MVLQPVDFESTASTDSATRACGNSQFIEIRTLTQAYNGKICYHPAMSRVFLLVFCALSVAFQAEAALISKVVGKVSDHFITSREVEINYILERALTDSPRQFAEGKFDLTPGSKQFRRELNGVFLEWVVELESQVFNVGHVEVSEIGVAKKQAMKRLKGLKAWSDLKVSPAELEKMLHKKLRAKKFIRTKADSSVVAVTEFEAKQYYDKNRANFGSLPFKVVKQKIQDYLKRTKVDERLKTWFEVLQRKYKVRSFVTPGTAGG